jgi:hypothetical protein
MVNKINPLPLPVRLELTLVEQHTLPHSTDKHLILFEQPENILLGTNTLAYFASQSVMKQKRFNNIVTCGQFN